MEHAAQADHVVFPTHILTLGKKKPKNLFLFLRNTLIHGRNTILQFLFHHSLKINHLKPFPYAQGISNSSSQSRVTQRSALIFQVWVGLMAAVLLLRFQQASKK